MRGLTKEERGRSGLTDKERGRLIVKERMRSGLGCWSTCLLVNQTK